MTGNADSSIGYEKSHGIHSKASVDSRHCQTYKHCYAPSDSHIRCLQGMRVTCLPPTLDHDRFSLSSNCIKMMNTFHLLVPFTQDKHYCSCSWRENNLECTDFASVISLKARVAFILQIKYVYSSSASLKRNRVVLNSEVRWLGC